MVEAEPDTSVITVNRSWWAPPKSAALLQPRSDDPLAKAEKMALNLRASKRQEILAYQNTVALVACMRGHLNKTYELPLMTQ